MLGQTSEEHQLQLSISRKIFPLIVVEKTLFLLRDLVTSIEVTDDSLENIEICVGVATDAPQDIEDIFYKRLISTAVSLMHDANNRDAKQYFIQTAAAAMIEPQQALKRHLIAQTREDSQSQTNQDVYWEQYKGYRIELGDDFDIFVEEDANTFHLDLDYSIYSSTRVQSVVDKMVADGFQCAIRTERSRIIVAITFQKEMAQRVIFKTLVDLQKVFRTLKSGRN